MAIMIPALPILHPLSTTTTSRKHPSTEAAQELNFCTGNSSPFSRRFGCASCKAYVLLLAICLARRVQVSLAGGESRSHPNTTQSDRATPDNGTWREAQEHEYPYSHTSIKVTVAPHETSSHSSVDEPPHSQLGRRPSGISESSEISRDDEDNLQATVDQRQPQNDIVDRPEDLDEGELIDVQPLEGSWGVPESLDLHQDLLLGPGEDLGMKDEGNLAGAFVDLNSADPMETEDQIASPACGGSCRRQIDDVLRALGDDGDDDDLSLMGSPFWAEDGAENQDSFLNGAPQLDTVEEASFLHQGAGVHAEALDMNDQLWDPDRSGEDGTLPIEYTIEKYSDTANAARRRQQSVPAASAEAAELRHAPQAAQRREGRPVLPPSAEKLGTAASDAKGAVLKSGRAGGAGGSEELAGLERREENGDVTAAEGAPSDDEQLRMMEDGGEETTGENDEAATLVDAVEAQDYLTDEFGPTGLEVEEAAPAVTEERQKLRAIADVNVTAKQVPSSAEYATGAPVEEEAPREGEEEEKFDKSYLGVVEDAAARRTVKPTPPGEPPSLLQGDTAHHQQQRRISFNSLLGPPSFIDWQTLGAVMTSPALRGSGSPFLAHTPQYYTSVPTEHTSQHGRIVVVFFGSMVVLLVIFLFCCCMVRRKRAHEAYMAAPMIIK